MLQSRLMTALPARRATESTSFQIQCINLEIMSRKIQRINWLPCSVKLFSSLTLLTFQPRIGISIHNISLSFSLVPYSVTNTPVHMYWATVGDRVSITCGNYTLFWFSHHLWLKPHVHHGLGMYIYMWFSWILLDHPMNVNHSVPAPQWLEEVWRRVRWSFYVLLTSTDLESFLHPLKIGSSLFWNQDL